MIVGWLGCLVLAIIKLLFDEIFFPLFSVTFVCLIDAVSPNATSNLHYFHVNIKGVGAVKGCVSLTLLQHLRADLSIPTGHPVAYATQPRHSLSSASLFNFYTHALHSLDVTGQQLSQVSVCFHLV